jgi:pimeloyl-ACP methyl ester carboxylesterase
MTEQLIEANGIEIMTESFGNPSGKPTLLIMGAGAPAIYWRDDFVNQLNDSGCFVVRYDNRDVGRSSTFDFMENPYTLDDMAKDAVGVMDHFGFESAHVIGASMGGMIVQTLLMNHAGRVKSATILMSSPISGGGDELDFSAGDLPGPDETWMTNFLEVIMQPVEGRDENIEKKINQYKMLVGSIEPFDADEFRPIAAKEVDQARDLDASTNHTFAIGMSSPADRRPFLMDVSVPTLVIHGTEDPILPYAHGVAIAEVIPGAELMALDRAGHEIPQCYLESVIGRIVAVQKSQS